MGQIFHGSATTTYAIRAAILRSKAPLKELATQREKPSPSGVSRLDRPLNTERLEPGGEHP
jgi:hypothetical protein